MEKRWLLVYDSYSGLMKEAVNLLSGTVSGYLNYVLIAKHVNELSIEEQNNNNLIVIGTAKNYIIKKCVDMKRLNIPYKSEGYSVFVGKSIFNEETQMIAVGGSDDKGALYGVVDFLNKYLGEYLYKAPHQYSDSVFINPFDRELCEWKISTAPAVKTRAIWTWGHVIYDYKRFFNNMIKLRLNEVVIWNDHSPINAKDVVLYAHSLGIKVIWGFAWGWTTKCVEEIEKFSNDSLSKIKESVLNIYKTEYADTMADGIYFQSFTEMDDDVVNGKCVAKIVTDLVNEVSNELLNVYPELHIQFGLHATSVKQRLEFLKEVDKRVYIVWEDCGAFPYSYLPSKVDGFEETFSLTSKLLNLRGCEEKFGAVFKGMLNLDWSTFEHFSGSYVLGERNESFIQNRQVKKNSVWKLIQASWLKNAEFIRKTVALIAETKDNAIIEALVEDGTFENEIMIPVALYAEFLWDPNINANDTIETVSKYPFVKFANV